MANTYANILKVGLQASYEALATKDNNILYFCSDTGKIYKGTADFSNNIVVAGTKPESPVAGKIYIFTDTQTVEAYVGGTWKVISYPVATAITVDSDDVHVASAKAVWDLVQDAVGDAIGGTSVMKSVAMTADKAGKLTVTKGDNSTVDVDLNGVVTKPTWDAAARKLTLPVVGDTAVEVNIGKDIFLDPAADNKYNTETGNIELYLNDGAGENAATKIEIPASSLVDTYTGGTANGTSVSVTDNVISVSLVVDPAENNSLTLTSAGLKVDLSAYATTEVMNTAVAGASSAASTAQAKADANETAIATLNAASSVEGSVDNKIAAAKSLIDADIAALSTATTSWGTF